MSICFQQKKLGSHAGAAVICGDSKAPRTRTLRAIAAGHTQIDGILCVTRSRHALSTARNGHS